MNGKNPFTKSDMKGNVSVVPVSKVTILSSLVSIGLVELEI